VLLGDAGAHLRAADSESGQEDEHDGRDGEQSVQGYDRDGKVLLGGSTGRDLFGRLWPRSTSSQPDREHRPAEDSDDDEDREGDPGERILVCDQIDLSATR